MDEQRKHAILFAATLLCARKLMPMMEDNGYVLSANVKFNSAGL